MKSCKRILLSTLTVLALIVPGATLTWAGDDVLVARRTERQLGSAPTVFYLLDEKAVLGFGHAALLVGDDSGWDYFSFGPHSVKEPMKNNLVHRHFDSLTAACASDELKRYNKELAWTTNDSSHTQAIRDRVLKEWDNSHYNVLTRNCFHMVADAIHAGSFDIDAKHAAPVSAYKANETKAPIHGAWPIHD
jgi:hypothetical protein